MQAQKYQQALDCLIPMGLTSENVAHRFGVTRQEQDQAAVSFSDQLILINFFFCCNSFDNVFSSINICNQVESHLKAAAATATGKFRDEIVPVTTKVK